MEKITFCIPSKNNLRYLKSSILSIKENSEIAHDIVVYIDSDNDGTESWLKENNVNYLLNNDSEPKGIAYGYNRCIESAKTSVVCMFHADMYMARGFDTNLLKHLKQKVIVAATRIEPPLHPAGKEKIVENFGMYPEDFRESEFNEYTNNLLEKNKDLTTKGIFAPWLAYKSDLVEIGMHDENLHSYYEDSDIFQRLILNGCSVVQSWDALVYHFTCRGGQFQDGVESVTKDPKFHQMKTESQRYYLRKWRYWIANDQYQHPILKKVFDIAFVVTGINDIGFLYFLEPLSSVIYIDNPVLLESYVEKEQPISKSNIRDRVKIGSPSEHDIIIEFSQKDFFSSPNESISTITNLSSILDDDLENNSEFECGVFKMRTKIVKDLSNQLIKIK